MIFPLSGIRKEAGQMLRNDLTPHILPSAAGGPLGYGAARVRPASRTPVSTPGYFDRMLANTSFGGANPNRASTQASLDLDRSRAEIMSRAKKDPSFRQRLLSSPAAGVYYGFRPRQLRVDPNYLSGMNEE